MARTNKTCLTILTFLFLFSGLADARSERPRLGNLPEDDEAARERWDEAEIDPTPEERKALIDQACAELLHEATAAQRSGNLLAARALLERILVLDSRHVEARRRLRAFRRQQEKPARSRSGRSAPRQNLKAKLEAELDKAYRAGRWDDARKLGEKLLAVDPGNERVRERMERIEGHLFDEAVARGKKREAAGDLEGAVDAYQVALGIRDDSALQSVVEKLQARTDAKNRHRSEALYLEALSAFQNGRKPDALRLCREALKLDPGNIYASRMLIRLGGKPR